MSVVPSISRSIMSTPSTPSRKVLEGIFAINKPQWTSSAGVLRDLQTHFQTSPLFTPWLDSQRRSMMLANAKKKHIDGLKVKLGHGGTLDPMATGVLIVGVGRGTKGLGSFLECTKSYECVVLFGAATDSYDAVGKVVGRAAYQHVTRDMVEEKLAQFRGKIMQKPSIFSALKVDGKKMYEYARSGKDVPEVAARPVEVHELELVEWLEPGSHEFRWPEEEVDDVEKEGAEKLMGVEKTGIRKEDADQHAKTVAKRGRKRPRTPDLDDDDHVEGAGHQPKRPRTDSEPAMSGALPMQDEVDTEPAEQQEEQKLHRADQVDAQVEAEQADQNTDQNTTTQDKSSQQQSPQTSPSPPAARLRMTVSSGFYVRSLAHSLGLSCTSHGLMSSLIRLRQGSYTLGTNVLEWSELEAGPDVWEPKVQAWLEEYMSAQGWEGEEVEDEDEWAERKARMKGARWEKREGDRVRSYQGSRGTRENDRESKGKSASRYYGGRVTAHSHNSHRDKDRDRHRHRDGHREREQTSSRD